LRAFIREYLFVLLFQVGAESLASENASRLAAMQRAEKNIDGTLEDLDLKLHRIRQESIDEELFDVISGYEALTAVRRPSRCRAIVARGLPIHTSRLTPPRYLEQLRQGSSFGLF
jgi:F-type H+-transporting ATPase subunit gamma